MWFSPACQYFVAQGTLNILQFSAHDLISFKKTKNPTGSRDIIQYRIWCPFTDFLLPGSAHWEAVLDIGAFCPHVHPWAATTLTHTLFHQAAIAFPKGKSYSYYFFFQEKFNCDSILLRRVLLSSVLWFQNYRGFEQPAPTLSFSTNPLTFSVPFCRMSGLSFSAHIAKIPVLYPVSLIQSCHCFLAWVLFPLAAERKPKLREFKWLAPNLMVNEKAKWLRVIMCTPFISWPHKLLFNYPI